MTYDPNQKYNPNWKPTPKQQKFIDCYDGDGIKAALEAGFSNNGVRVTVHRLLTNPNVVEAIQKRQEKPRALRIATREERQNFWTRVMLGEEKEKIVDKEGNEVEVTPAMKDRLKAAELLGKSEADFTDVIKGDAELKINILQFSEQKEVDDEG